MNNGEQKKIAPSSAALAYLGDVVWEVLVRRMLVEQGVSRPSEKALAYVTAPAQSAAAERILPHLTEEEADVFRRARNNVHAHIPKQATAAQYRSATGLEAVFGYLDWAGMEERKTELFRLALGDS